MKKKIEKIIDGFAFESMTNTEAVETTDKILSLFLKEYEKRKPKESMVVGIGDNHDIYGVEIYNKAIKLVDEVIYKMMK
jgi:DNA repair photolyase